MEAIFGGVRETAFSAGKTIMRNVNQPRLRGDASTRTGRAEHAGARPMKAHQVCPPCESGGEFRIFCQICRQPLPGFARRTCSKECQKVLKSERRKSHSVRCWIAPDGSGKKVRRWVPRQFVMPLDKGVSKVSQPRRAILSKGAPPKTREAENG